MTVLVGQIVDSVLAPSAQKQEPLWKRELRGEMAILQPSVQELVWAWLSRQRSPHTGAAYGRDLREWLAFCNQFDLDPLTVDVGHGDVYARSLQVRGLSARSAARKLAAVSSWYTYLVRRRAIRVNEFAGANRPEINRKESKTVGLTETEAAALIRAAMNDHGPRRLRTAAIIGLLLSVGPRVAEVVALELGSLGYERGMRTVRIVGKGGKIRTRQLPAEAADVVDAYLVERGDAPGPLFVTASGKALSARDVASLVRRIAIQAGLFKPERVTPHTLRHTFATLAEERGSSVREIQDALGHESTATTEIYLHAPKRLESDPSVKVAKVLW
ncbi:tyrosine-type recombinase/integrase [Streptosporangium amethystogenes subsp. fukuiense]|uniref:Tyrosine-type recombinase/integrase n=1 Tax=Streptosporangium amethystogenes subsp. fukuiense TaxID=698418 RepID=A0ABW2T5V4_9ACTN